MTTVLMAYASERGTTAEIAEEVAETIRASGIDAHARPAVEIRDIDACDAVVLGSALYMYRWRKDALRFLKRFRRDLGTRPVWLFQSGPLDHSADEQELPLPGKVRNLGEAIGIRGHATFGGALTPDAEGFMAHKMVEGGTVGDFRNHDALRAWAEAIAADLGALVSTGGDAG